MDVLVVGGGVIGLATARFLAESGARVTLVERGEIANEASWGNCGLITPSHSDPLTQPASLRVAASSVFDPMAPLYVAPTLNLQRLAWLFGFALRCREAHRRKAQAARSALLFSTRSLIEPDMTSWSANGLTTVYHDKANFDRGVAVHQAQHNLGIRFEVWTQDQLIEREPIVHRRAVGGIFATTDGHVDPRRMCQALAEHAQAAGVEIRAGVEAKLRREGPRVVGVETPDGPLDAEHTVLAAGAWSRTLARSIGVRLPIEPGKGYSLTWTTGEEPNQVSKLPPIQTPIYMYEPKVVATPWAHGLRLGSTMEFVGFNETMDRQRINRLQIGARSFLDYDWNYAMGVPWSGFRPMSVDEIPIIGPVPQRQGLWIASGHGMLGMSQSLATGRLLAELMSGTEPHLDPTPYAPSRFTKW